jgi:L-fucono-1,5-lactonase
MTDIDAHQHYWRLQRNDYGWLTPELAPIWRDFGPHDLAPLRAVHGITSTILVQAAPTDAETAFLLDLAEHEDSIAGVIGWTDFAAPNASGRIAELAQNRLLVGLRPMLQDLEDDGWILRPECAAAFEAVLQSNLVFDALVRPRHLPVVDELAARYPALAIVVDHGAKPEIAKGAIEQWRIDILALGQRPNVSVKLSGLVTEAGPGWNTAQIAPYASTLIAAFGPRRVLWGSDWPVLLLAGSYGDWHKTCEVLLAPLAAPDREAIFGGNAARLYLDKRGRNAC